MLRQPVRAGRSDLFYPVRPIVLKSAPKGVSGALPRCYGESVVAGISGEFCRLPDHLASPSWQTKSSPNDSWETSDQIVTAIRAAQQLRIARRKKWTTRVRSGAVRIAGWQIPAIGLHSLYAFGTRTTTVPAILSCHAWVAPSKGDPAESQTVNGQ